MLDTSIILLRAFSPAPLRRVVGLLAIFALVLQAVLAMPLALRMATDDEGLFPLGAAICTASMDGRIAGSNTHPTRQLPTHDHGQCLICNGHAAPLGLLVLAVGVVLGLFCPGLIRLRSPTGPPRCDRFYRPYWSRAPPVAA